MVEHVLGIKPLSSIVQTQHGPISDTAAELARLIASRDDVFEVARALIKVLKAGP